MWSGSSKISSRVGLGRAELENFQKKSQKTKKNKFRFFGVGMWSGSINISSRVGLGRAELGQMGSKKHNKSPC